MRAFSPVPARTLSPGPRASFPTPNLSSLLKNIAGSSPTTTYFPFLTAQSLVTSGHSAAHRGFGAAGAKRRKRLSYADWIDPAACVPSPPSSSTWSNALHSNAVVIAVCGFSSVAGNWRRTHLCWHYSEILYRGVRTSHSRPARQSPADCQ